MKDEAAHLKINVLKDGLAAHSRALGKLNQVISKLSDEMEEMKEQINCIAAEVSPQTESSQNCSG